jgi:hypothetical protein
VNNEAKVFAKLGLAAARVIPVSVTVWFTVEKKPSRLAGLLGRRRASVRQRVWTTGRCESAIVTDEGIHYKISAPAPDAGPATTHSAWLDFGYGRIDAVMNQTQVEPGNKVFLDYRVPHPCVN